MGIGVGIFWSLKKFDSVSEGFFAGVAIFVVFVVVLVWLCRLVSAVYVCIQISHEIGLQASAIEDVEE